MKHPVLGTDIGGANLKYASSCGTAASREFAMWLTPEKLANTLTEDLQRDFLDHDLKPATLAVTMTG